MNKIYFNTINLEKSNLRDQTHFRLVVQLVSKPFYSNGARYVQNQKSIFIPSATGRKSENCFFLNPKKQNFKNFRKVRHCREIFDVHFEIIFSSIFEG